MGWTELNMLLNPNCIGGGGVDKIAKFSEKCPFSYHNNTACIKQISLIDTALDITNNYNFNSKR